MSKTKRMTTPKGVASWPRLNDPDFKFEPDGVYQVKLRLGPADAKKLMETLNKELDAYYAEQAKEAAKEGKKKLKRADVPWGECVDEHGKETGEVEFNFKMSARYTAKDGSTVEQRPVLFDAKTNPMTDRVGSGSIIRVGFEPYLWNTPALGVGISLRLKAVQVLELKQWAPSNKASDYGFSTEEGFETAFAEPEKPEDDSAEEAEDGAGF
jgi:hypothetical protein